MNRALMGHESSDPPIGIQLVCAPIVSHYDKPDPSWNVFITKGAWQARIQTGEILLFAPEMVLLKFKNASQVSALRVEPMSETTAMEVLAAREDVEFAELNTLQQRQFMPNDIQVSQQWHHNRLGSYHAWERSLGNSAVRIAIVDTPFQMDHPDLADNTVPGWSVVSNAQITASSGIEHSTVGAGLAAAVIHNGLGIAGVGNCRILPIHINGFTEEMYSAVLWAADNDVRVVNLSWSGADSPSLNEAGLYLKEHARGLLFMAGVNGGGTLNYPNHPHIYCVSMTDAADNPQSRSGPHIDFAAPGHELLSTTSGSTYITASGTSYSTPLLAGIAGVLLSINPTLAPEELIDLLIATADDKGQPGRDDFFGWGRIHFGRAADAAYHTLPHILRIARLNGQVTVTARHQNGLDYSLWKSSQLSPTAWQRALEAGSEVSDASVTFTDAEPADPLTFYRVLATLPE